MKRTPEVIRADVEMGLRLHAMLRVVKSGLEEISDRLRADALAHPEEHKPLAEECREGMKWTAPGGLTVILTADKLVTQFEDEKPTEAKVREIIYGFIHATMPEIFADADERHKKAQEIYSELFTRWTGWTRTIVDGLDFRLAVEKLMPQQPTCAEMLIDALKSRDPKTGLPLSDVKTEWAALEKDRAAAESEKAAKKLMGKITKAAKAGKEAA